VNSSDVLRASRYRLRIIATGSAGPGCTVAIVLRQDQSAERFRDPGKLLCCFAGEILVRCPRCGSTAVVVAESASATIPRFWHADEDHRWRGRRFACHTCGTTAACDAPQTDVTVRWPASPGPRDPYFGLPLWLSAQSGTNVLWAYNGEHLDLLAAYVSARLRERGEVMDSLIERLPRWIKAAGNREQVLRTINRLRGSL
jgi:hypothetical protein